MSEIYIQEYLVVDRETARIRISKNFLKPFITLCFEFHEADTRTDCTHSKAAMNPLIPTSASSHLAKIAAS